VFIHMTEVLTFTLVGILVYFAADWLLRQIEKFRGKEFAEYRSIVFFALFLGLVMFSFELIRLYTPSGKPGATSITQQPASAAVPSSPELPRK